MLIQFWYLILIRPVTVRRMGYLRLTSIAMVRVQGMYSNVIGLNLIFDFQSSGSAVIIFLWVQTSEYTKSRV